MSLLHIFNHFLRHLANFLSSCHLVLLTTMVQMVATSIELRQSHHLRFFVKLLLGNCHVSPVDRVRLVLLQFFFLLYTGTALSDMSPKLGRQRHFFYAGDDTCSHLLIRVG